MPLDGGWLFGLMAAAWQAQLGFLDTPFRVFGLRGRRRCVHSSSSSLVLGDWGSSVPRRRLGGVNGVGWGIPHGEGKGLSAD